MRQPVPALSFARRRPRHPVAEAMAIAARIEPDPCLREDWFRNDPIAELHGLTAERAVAQGRTAELVRMLRGVEAGTRGR